MIDFLRLLQVLTSKQVDFVIVGGTSAVLYGSATATYDLDVLMRFDRENGARLLEAVPTCSITVLRRSAVQRT